MSVNDIATSFRKGAEDMVGAALVIGMAKGIVLILGGTKCWYTYHFKYYS